MVTCLVLLLAEGASSLSVVSYSDVDATGSLATAIGASFGAAFDFCVVAISECAFVHGKYSIFNQYCNVSNAIASNLIALVRLPCFVSSKMCLDADGSDFLNILCCHAAVLGLQWCIWYTIHETCIHTRYEMMSV